MKKCLQEDLRRSPVVALLGPRPGAKTTLARTLRSSESTVGAGDTFNAATLAGLRDDLAWAAAVEAAVEGASLAAG